MRRSRTAMARRVGDEMVILDVASGRYFGLNEVGAFVWDRLERRAGPRRDSWLPSPLPTTSTPRRQPAMLTICSTISTLAASSSHDRTGPVAESGQRSPATVSSGGPSRASKRSTAASGLASSTRGRLSDATSTVYSGRRATTARTTTTRLDSSIGNATPSNSTSRRMDGSSSRAPARGESCSAWKRWDSGRSASILPNISSLSAATLSVNARATRSSS